jgi:zinc/manganese transport system permease protein
VRAITGGLFEPGFFGSAEVHQALAVGGIAAVVCAMVGLFAVARGQSFGGHALGDVAAAGGAGALLIGIPPITGFVVLGIAGAGLMELAGSRNARGRDLSTGIVLGAAIGLSALFLYLGAVSGAATGAVQQVLFGSIFTVPAGTLAVEAALGVVAVAIVAAISRPLLLSTVSPDIAAARGVQVRLVGLLYALALAVSVGLSCVVVGAVLSTALLIGPAAAALRLGRTIRGALTWSCLIAVAATWLGVLLAYDSYYWGHSRQALPVSFFVVVLVLAAYLISGLPARRAAGRGRPAATAAAAATGPDSGARAEPRQAGR